MDIDGILNELENVSCGITPDTAPKKITYPFIYLEGASQIEIDYLKKNLPKGDVPFMLKIGNSYAHICNTDISLRTVKSILQFGRNDGKFKTDKYTEVTVMSLLSYVLLD